MLEGVIGEKLTLSLAKAAKYADLLGYSRKRFIALCVQDLLDREGLKMKVNLEAA